MRLIPILLLAFGAVLAMATHRTAAVSAAQPRSADAQLTIDECGACHMPFPPRFLPKSSWKRIMADLENHFGGDASLDPDTRDRIAAFYDRYGAERGDNVLRIIDTWWWQRIHRDNIPERVWVHLDSPANCLACHGASRRGSGNN